MDNNQQWQKPKRRLICRIPAIPGTILSIVHRLSHSVFRWVTGTLFTTNFTRYSVLREGKKLTQCDKTKVSLLGFIFIPVQYTTRATAIVNHGELNPHWIIFLITLLTIWIGHQWFYLTLRLQKKVKSKKFQLCHVLLDCFSLMFIFFNPWFLCKKHFNWPHYLENWPSNR